MEEFKEKKSYWPHAILVGIFLIIIACIWTIKVALANPVEMDDFYLQKYQKVDKNINTIIKKQKAFFKRFVLEYQSVVFKLNEENTISFSIKDKKTNLHVENAQILTILTRPETNAYNQEFKPKYTQNGKFTISGIKISKPGRWQFKSKIKIGDLEGFVEHEILAVKP